MATKTNRKDNKGRVLNTGEYQRKDGTYEYRYKENGKRHSEYANTISELRKKIKIIKEKQVLGLNPYESNISVYELTKRYLSTKRKIDSVTMYNYKNGVENHIKDSTFGNACIGDITKKDVMDFYDTLVDDNGNRKNGVISILQHVLHPSFEMAIESRLISINPTHNIFKDYNIELKKKDALSIAEQNALLEFTKFDRYYHRYHHMIVIMLGTGIRASETFGLTWNNVDMKKGTIKIDHQLRYRNLDGTHMKYSIVPPKSDAGYRTIYMTDEVKKSFKVLQKRRMMDGKNPFEIDGYSDFVFTSDANNRPVTPATFSRILDKCVEMYNKQTGCLDDEEDAVFLPHISAHVLRHTACTRMAENGMDVKVLQYVMGHTTSRLTLDVYDHVKEDRVKNEFEKLNNIVSIKGA